MWKSKVLSDDGIKPPSASVNSLNPGLIYFNNARIQVNLMAKEVIFTQSNIFEIYLWPFTVGQDFKLGYSWFSNC